MAALTHSIRLLPDDDDSVAVKVHRLVCDDRSDRDDDGDEDEDNAIDDERL
jgi:hypothetical protein